MRAFLKVTAQLAVIFLIAAIVFTAGTGAGIAPGLTAGAALVAALLGLFLATAVLRANVQIEQERKTPRTADEFWRELERSRRHERHFTVAALERLDGLPVTEYDANTASFSKAIRRVDSLWIDSGRVILLLPEASADKAESALSRLTHAIAENRLPEMEYRSATFPDDGVTGGALLELLGSPPAAIESASPALQGAKATMAEAQLLVSDDEF